MLFFKYKCIQISKQKYRLIKFQIFSFASVQKGILKMFKYLTKKEKKILPQIQTNSQSFQAPKIGSSVS